jgi:hypothetical protein
MHKILTNMKLLTMSKWSKPLDSTYYFDTTQILVQATRKVHKSLKNYSCHKHYHQAQKYTCFKECDLCKTSQNTTDFCACMQDEKDYKMPQTFSLGTKIK